MTDSRKYIWLSSVNYQYGVSSGSPVHVIGNLDAKEVYVTEGALKGTIAHYLSGSTFLCVPGVNQHRNLRPILESLSKRNLQLVYETYDMDKKMPVACDGQYTKYSLPVKRMLWDTDENKEWRGQIKGIDDLYYDLYINQSDKMF